MSSGKQRDGEQDRILANHGTVKKAVKQKCGIICPVTKIGHGQTGREFVWADPPTMFSYASQVNNLATGLGLILPSMKSYKSCISAEVAVKLVLILFALICEFRHDGYDFLLQRGLVVLVSSLRSSMQFI